MQTCTFVEIQVQQLNRNFLSHVECFDERFGDFSLILHSVSSAVKTRHLFELPMTVCDYHSHNFAIFAVGTDFNGKTSEYRADRRTN